MTSSRILLDTNVLSELMRPKPDAQVLRWFSARGAQVRFVVSVITQAEILLGIALLPAGKRRTALAGVAAQMFEREFHGLNLAFDERAAPAYAAIMAASSRKGRPMSVEDGQIAAIATVHRLPLATRNVRDFESIAGLAIVDPWARAA